MSHPSHGTTDQPAAPEARRAEFVWILAALFATGWAANHFASMIPAISAAEHLGRLTLDAIFGVYAVGLLPGLIAGGRVSDTLGRAPVARAGMLTALVGTLVMLASQQSAPLLVGRFVVGIGVGLTVSACTAWASDLRGSAGAATVGTVLSAGFALGPFTSGILASWGRLTAAFGLAAIIVAVALVAGVLIAREGRTPGAVETTHDQTSVSDGSGVTRALSWALPLAPWVFASVTLAFVTLPSHSSLGMSPSVAAGAAALISVGAGVLIQLLGRARQWGPYAGVVGALLAAAAYTTVAAVPALPRWSCVALFVVLGAAYGLCLREGLIDLEAAAPASVRGTLTGVFYTVTYLGFGLPLLLTSVGPRAGPIVLLVMAALACVAALNRACRLRADSHRRR